MTLTREFCTRIMECGAYESEGGDRCGILDVDLDAMEIDECSLIMDMIAEAQEDVAKVRICLHADICGKFSLPNSVEKKAVI